MKLVPTTVKVNNDVSPLPCITACVRGIPTAATTTLNSHYQFNLHHCNMYYYYYHPTIVVRH